ncbi:MAG TPA: wax ester/triacylglycerol synthase domain-containing protein, partial [Nocardioidaceae bacterium]|nr:wax ester/triacylglycerol synthase domain-containing protein [Nocardioidaceae bacterium]
MGTKKTRVPPLDAGWLWLESKSNLMHGCMLAVFTPPEGAGADYVLTAVSEMRKHDVATSPFDRKLAEGPFSGLVPRWEKVPSVDTDYHLRYTRLEEPSEREFGRLVSEIQGGELDPDYPLWTIDVIDNLPGGRFALVGKMHHALVDGVSALGILAQWLSPESGTRDVPPMWAYERAPRKPRATTSAPRSNILRTILGLLRAFRLAVTGVSARPYSAPRSPMNVPITSDRRVSTLSLDLNRFRKLADRGDATINDVLLAVCSAGLRRYLTETDSLPERPLITNIPVSVRSEAGAGSGGNQISWAMLSLGT